MSPHHCSTIQGECVEGQGVIHTRQWSVVFSFARHTVSVRDAEFMVSGQGIRNADAVSVDAHPWFHESVPAVSASLIARAFGVLCITIASPALPQDANLFLRRDVSRVVAHAIALTASVLLQRRPELVGCQRITPSDVIRFDCRTFAGIKVAVNVYIRSAPATGVRCIARVLIAHSMLPQTGWER